MFDPDLLRMIGFLPNEYLYYYYHREKALANILKSGATRGQTIEQVNKQMMEELKGDGYGRRSRRRTADFPVLYAGS